MSVRIGGFRAVCIASTILLGALKTAEAQTSYPSFQQPRVVSREFNFGIADGDGITPFVFQWREGTSVGSQLSFDVGLADPEQEGADVFLILGGQYARTIARSRADMPLDVLLTAGAFTQFGNDITFLSIPVGVSLGHRFPIEGTAMAITPYIHPRLALQYVSFDTPDGDNSDTEVDIAFDIGGNLEFTPQLALRLSATFGDNDVLGLSLAWTPRGLRTSAAPARTTR
jgi:hypothetical protein